MMKVERTSKTSVNAYQITRPTPQKQSPSKKERILLGLDVRKGIKGKSHSSNCKLEGCCAVTCLGIAGKCQLVPKSFTVVHASNKKVTYTIKTQNARGIEYLDAHGCAQDGDKYRVE
jgi:hypothetical protein